MSKHTPEPWQCYADLPSTEPDWHIVTNASRMRVIANIHIEPGNEMDEANAKRIVMCVNAMEGMGDMKVGSVKRLFEALQKQIAEWKAFKYSGYVPPEDGDARYYAEAAVSNCADELKELLSEALRELGEEV